MKFEHYEIVILTISHATIDTKNVRTPQQDTNFFHINIFAKPAKLCNSNNLLCSTHVAINNTHDHHQYNK
ncbi:hypothetical protein DERF_011495 [Dermatophagoides farinae]|uniref:Uncharacterized protein n=1 Tax=Dermatophagoides farinae TaxID=6954 RepID=A0A922HVJ0_DERFA|nr:hypothetical protein DERF_011495 [Dermatophagoides farinae]